MRDAAVLATSIGSRGLRKIDTCYNRAAMSVSTIKMTAKQFLELGEDPPGVRLELVDGEIAVSPSPIPNHAFTLLALGSILRAHVEKHRLGQLFTDVDTIFGEHDVRRPDLLFFQKKRLHLIGDKAMH